MKDVRIKYQNLLKTNEIPCIEACNWAEEQKYVDVVDLVQNAKLEWRQWVAFHTFDTDTLLALAADQDSAVRKAVAGNANTPTDTLLALAADQYWAVRYAVAGNANTPTDTLLALAADQDSDVRKAVAGNANYKP